MTTASASVPGTAETYRTFMRGFPTGVAIVTTLDEGDQPVGFTCSSLCGLSLTPPMLLICVDNASSTLERIRARELFAVNLLSDRGRAVADLFAGHGEDRFARTVWRPTELRRLPFLVEAAHAVSECRVVRMDVAGDHTIVVGSVEAVTTLGREPTPLLHGLGRYRVWSESLT